MSLPLPTFFFGITILSNAHDRANLLFNFVQESMDQMQVIVQNIKYQNTYSKVSVDFILSGETPGAKLLKSKV